MEILFYDFFFIDFVNLTGIYLFFHVRSKRMHLRGISFGFSILSHVYRIDRRHSALDFIIAVCKKHYVLIDFMRAEKRDWFST